MSELGRIVFVLGLVLAAAGAILWLFGGKGWFGKLPGDIHISKGNFQFYFPLVTCLIISLVLSLVLWLFRR